MILIAGATGRLGPRIVRLLVARGLGVRVIARDRTRAANLEEMGAEVLVGDIRDSDAVDRAAEGARTIVSAISGFGGGRHTSPRTVDRDGNRNLIGSAERAGAEHFVLLSTYGAASDHPIELFRMKHLAEQSLLPARSARRFSGAPPSWRPG